MPNSKQIAQALEEIGVLLELSGENPFKTRAYFNAARIVQSNEAELGEFVAQAVAGEIKGIGQALSEKIQTLYETGALPYLDELRSRFPSGLFDVMRVPGLGAKKVKILYEELGIASLGELEYACQENRLVDLKGFGKKTQDNILLGIARLAKYIGRFRFPTGLRAAEALIPALKKSGAVQRIEVAGSLRRRMETVKDVDLLATSDNAPALMETFVHHPAVAQITGHGETKSSVVLTSGIAVDLRVVEDAQFATALAHFTGSREHNTQLRALAKKRGFKLNEYGLFDGETPLPIADEAELYRRLGLHFIPPETREADGEIEFAADHEFPRLIERGDLRGILHCHTTFSDGGNTVRQMAEAVRDMGLDYLGISDHSQTAAYAGGLRPDDIKRQHEEIDRINEALAPFRVFKGIESDILPDGSLDYDEKTLAQFDFIIASVHSHFKMDEATMTARIVRAIENPFTTILGHPTGRLLLSRDAYPLNMAAVLEAAAAHGVAVELNANPHRLDLDWRHHRKAKELGIPIPICPDAHSIEGLADIEYGLGIARKGRLTAADVLTAWSTEDIFAFMQRRKS